MEKDVDEVITKYKELIYRIAYINLKIIADAEDVTQDVLEKYVKNTKKFKDKEHERNWLIRVTLNQCKNLSKSAWKRYTVPIDENLCLKLQTEEQEDIFEDLDYLEEKYKQVVQLFYYEDLSIATISKILNISEANVRTRLKRAKEKIKIRKERYF